MRNLYPRLAATNLKKNRRFYLPYLLACIVIVALFCIILTLASDPYLGQMQHGGSVSQVLGFGVSIMALFSAIILFYTNSTFTKQRKREFAIYNILGMEKRHISYVLFWESLYTAAMALFFGLVAAGVFSKLLQLVLMRLIGGEATFGLNIRLMSIGYTVAFFGRCFCCCCSIPSASSICRTPCSCCAPAARASASRAASGSSHCSARCALPRAISFLCAQTWPYTPSRISSRRSSLSSSARISRSSR